MRPLCDGDVDLEPPREGLREPDAEAQTDEGRHRAVGDRRGEGQGDGPCGVVDGDGRLGDDAELFQSVGVLRVGDGSQVLEDLAGVDGFPRWVVVGEGGRGLSQSFFVREEVQNE